MRSGRAAPFLLIGITAIWGSTFVLVQDVTAEMPVFGFLAWRFAIATLTLVVVRPRALAGIRRVDLGRGVLIGLFLGAGYVFQTIGLQTTSATVSGFVTGMFVVLTPLVAAVVAGRAVPPLTGLAVLLAACGLALLTLRGVSVGVGEGLTLLCALMFACQIVALSEWSEPHTAYRLTIVQVATVAIACAVVAPFTGGLAPPPSPRAWVGTVFLALAATAAAYLVQTWAQAHLAPTRAAIILTLEPVFAGLFGVLFAQNVLTIGMAVGAGLILVAMLLVEAGPQPAAVP